MPFSDVTDSDAIARLLGKAQAMSPVGCWVYDLQADSVVWSDQLFDIFGVSRDRTPAFAEQRSLFTEASWSELSARVADARDGGTPYNLVLRVVRPDGRLCWARARGACEIGPAGEITHLFGTFQDVTEAQERRMELERREAALARSNRALSEFAYAASHDLQEPLRAVAGCAQVLERRYADHFDDTGRELVGHVVSGAVRMKTLLGDLLTFSRIGTSSSKESDVDLASLARGAWARLVAAEEGIDADLSIQGSGFARGDEAELRLLVENLLSNALKYRSEQALRVRVVLRRTEDRIAMSVQDNGIGIEPRFHDQVFEVFKRLHTREHSPGTGIGLALCKRVIEHYGGTIGVDPGFSAGTRVVFDLPAATEQRHA